MNMRSLFSVGGTVASPAPHAPVPPPAHAERRRRRPSGAPPPLPRQIGRSGRGWIAVAVLLCGWAVVMLVSPAARRITDRLDSQALRAISEVRTGWLTNVARAIDRVSTGWTMFVIAIALIVATVICKRWRHLFTFLATVLVIEIFGLLLIEATSRPRPYDVETIGRWQGYSLPSATVAIVSFTTIGVVYMLVVPGHPRWIAKRIAIAVILLCAAARLYLAVDHPSDVVIAVAIGVALPLLAFRFFTPNDVFPVKYRTGKTAHLDITGPRGEAIRRAVEEQLGVSVDDLKPIGLAGSGGSTPVRMRVAGEPGRFLFGKLYAMNHVRADRWYKLGRTILYGRLEDEKAFPSVRRLVQHEDYALRVMRDGGIVTPEPYGVVELTPEREYLLVTEFVDGGVEIGEAEVDDQLIDEGLAMVRQLWNAGLAHRDIKPANLLVRDGHLVVIDVAFAQIRPSAWREAVDLANMMLVLAVRTDAERVYGRALAYFSAEEIAEAFAAARGIASPSQLRAVVKDDGRDLLARFRALAPARRPISLQTWSVKRGLLATGLAAGSVLSLVQVYNLFTPAELPISDSPTCGTSDVMVLMAQSVPSASAVPCVAALPAGWDIGGTRIRNGSSVFWLDSTAAGDHAVEVTLQSRERCDVDRDMEVPSDEPGVRRFERPEQLPPALRATRLYLLDGGCVTYRFEFDGDANASAMVALDTALSFQPRSELVADVDRQSGLALCGHGAPACTGAES
jgi:tRNA A-37 threonylcarbamoyl transferase component Bud32/membrane-associated phospholipid phosphatase